MDSYVNSKYPEVSEKQRWTIGSDLEPAPI